MTHNIIYTDALKKDEKLGFGICNGIKFVVVFSIKRTDY